MFSRFFKPRWQHTNPDIRCLAVEQLDARNDAEILAKLVRGDVTEKVRAAAACKLIDLTLLDNVIQCDQSQYVRDAAQQRMMALLAGASPDSPPIETRLRLIRLTNNSAVLAYIAEHSPDSVCREAAVVGVSDDELLLRLALNGADEALRFAACRNIEDLTLLKKLSRAGRDKRVNRLARERAKALTDASRDAQQRDQRRQQLLAKLAAHAQRPLDPLYAAQFEQLSKQWTDVAEDAPEEQQLQAHRHSAACQQRIDAESIQRQQQEQQQHAIEQRQQALKTLRHIFDEVDSDSWPQHRGALRSIIDTQERRWQHAVEAVEPTADEQAEIEKLLAFARDTLALANDALQLAESEEDQQEALANLAQHWPEQIAAPGPLLAYLQPLAESTPQTPVSIAPTEHKPKKSEHKGLMISLSKALRDGNLRQANRLWHRAEEILKDQNDPALEKTLATHQERRQELMDWHRFAAQPKKEALCSEMEALGNSTMDPAELATAIQALQEEWRQLMSSDHAEDDTLWQRFKTASDTAFAPCAAYFAERDKHKAANLEKKQALLTHIETYLAQFDPATADWSAVWQIRRQAPKDWRALEPVDRAQAKAAEKRFSALLQQLDNHLDNAISQAKRVREPLLQEADALLAHEDLTQACKRAVELQQVWRQSPWLPPAEHRKQQRQFRQSMDTLFARRKNEQKAEQSARQSQIDEINTLLSTAASILDQATAVDQRDDINTQLQLIKGFDATSALPRELQQRQTATLNALRQRLIEIEQRQQRSQWITPIAQAAEHDEPSDTELDLLVAVEVLCEVPSPQDQHGRRQQWQLKRLQSAMSSAQKPASEELSALLTTLVSEPLTPQSKQRLTKALEITAAGEPSDD